MNVFWLSVGISMRQLLLLDATNYFDPTTQHHDVSVQSTLDRRPMHYSQKNGPVESECKLNNVNPHIIRNQIQNQIEVTLNGHKYYKSCHYQTNTEF